MADIQKKDLKFLIERYRSPKVKHLGKDVELAFRSAASDLEFLCKGGRILNG